MSHGTTYPRRFVPPPQPGEGGTQLGNSYLSTWANCPRDWYNSYYRPTVTQDADGQEVLYRGITSRYQSEFLLGGSIFHAGLAEWYRSGVRDGEDTGEYSIDPAMDAFNLAADSFRDSYAEGPDKADRDRLMFETMLRAYHDQYGPTASNPDWPSIRVACDEKGEPLIERAWAFPLGDGYVYTCRTDLIIEHRGYLAVMEHKTSAGGMWVNNRIKALPWDSQFAGELWILNQLFPDEPLDGVLVNIVVKPDRRSGKLPPVLAVREITRRSQGQLDRWRGTAQTILMNIDEAVSGLESELHNMGGQITEALVDRWFPDTGTRTGQCTAFRGCQFQALCSQAGMEHRQLAEYRPRLREEIERMKENPYA